jgi:transglutaminase-like putative cysteine protease
MKQGPDAMTILTVRHVTTYEYRRPVAFGDHILMLRPRDDADQLMLDTDIAITPEPRRLDWGRDAFGNHVATASFAERAASLRFVSAMRLDVAPFDLDRAAIDGPGRRVPFAYPDADLQALAPFRAPLGSFPDVERWASGFLGWDGTADTRELLVAMTRAIRETCRHVARHERGIQSPGETLDRGSGSCRDLAVLMIAALRSLGFAARFVSGYLRVDDDDDSLTGGNTHAWVQVHVPGPGWVDFDPSSGAIGNKDLVRVAVVNDPSEAIPLQGTWFGSASDHIAMQVAVKVTAGASAPDRMGRPGL